MIDAKEFRLGNYLKAIYCQEERFEVIDYISDEHGVTTNGCGSVVKYEPIPIDEKWLVKFEFLSFQNEFLDLDKAIVIHKEPEGFDCDTWAFIMDSLFIRHIYYIHQLQNLYYYLTGEELIIKDNGKT